jgi:hypothetical protein
MLKLMKLFPGAEQYFVKHVPELRDYLVYADDKVVDGIMGKIKDMVQEYLWDLVGEWEQNDEYYWEMLRDEGYMDEEGDVDWEKAPQYLEVNDELRRLVDDVTNVIDMTAEQVKKEAADSNDDDSNEWTVGNIELLLSNMIKQMYGRYEGDGGVAAFLKERVWVDYKWQTNEWQVVKRSPRWGK